MIEFFVGGIVGLSLGILLGISIGRQREREGYWFHSASEVKRQALLKEQRESLRRFWRMIQDDKYDDFGG